MKVLIYQPLVPSYRVPIFEAIGSLPDVDLTVRAGDSNGSLVTIRNASAYRVEFAPLRQFRFGSKWMKAQWGQLRVLWERRPDVLIVPWDVQYVTMPLLLFASRFRGIRLLLWGHGYSKNSRHWFERIRNWAGRLATGVITYDSVTARELVTAHGFEARRVFCAQNALDQAPIERARKAWLDAPEALGSFRNTNRLDPSRTLLFCSRLEPDNGLRLLIDAVHLLSKRISRLRAVIIGDGPERSALQDKVRELGLSDIVTFTGAIYDEHNLAPWMLSASVCAYPTNIGLSVLHAFGYGLPVVTSGDLSSQNPERAALRDGENSLLFAPLTPEALARQCERLLSDAELRTRLSNEAHRTVTECFTLPNMLKGFKAALQLSDARCESSLA